MFLVEIWGRKRTLTVYLLLSGITGITMGLFTNDVMLFTLSMLLVSFFNLGAWGSVYPFTSELYPTKLRGKSFGLAEGIGKVIAVIAPLIFGALYQITGTVNVPLIVTMTVAIIGAIIVLIFAPETKKLIFD
jgi:putative MFS transporter